MKTLFVKLYWSIAVFRLELPEKIGKFIGHTLHIHIPAKRPSVPLEFCSMCGKPLAKLIAINTGDGWEIDWECDNDNCWGTGDTVPVVGWWPFWFGAWASSTDFERIGIEVV